MAQHHHSNGYTETESPNKSPALEALYQDLDAFIHELAAGQDDTLVLNPEDESAPNGFRGNGVKAVKPNGLKTRQSILSCSDEEPLSSGYSPLLEQYSRPFSEAISIRANYDNGSSNSDDHSSSTPAQSTSIEAQPSSTTTTATPTPTALSPPLSPSHLAVAQSLNSPVHVPRSSSLNQQSSAPATPVAVPAADALKSATPLSTPILTFPNYALLSETGAKLVKEVKILNEHRRMFCTAEYPSSFTGEEAVQIIEGLLPSGVPASVCLHLARSFVKTSPPLVSAISYSEKSLKRNTLYQSASEIYTLVDETAENEELPQGVFTPLTGCYTNFCLPGQGGCYAPCCPNRSLEFDKSKRKAELSRQTSLKSGTSSHDTTFSRAWSATVSREVLQSTPDAEIKRQEAIHEVIYTEEDYVRDLNLLDELFAKPLRSAQCLEADKRDEFCDYVFGNYLELLDLHRQLCRDLRDHQSECVARSSTATGGFVDQIGDIFLRYIHRFMDVYARYGPHVILAEHAVKKEAATNMLFSNFVHETEKQAECRKLPFRHFLILPVTRLQRYPLLIGAILKKTDDGHPDKEYLNQCNEILRSVASRMDELTKVTKQKKRILEIADAIRYKPEQEQSYQQLKLDDPHRSLVHEGRLTRRSHMGVETIDLHVFLFDHLLVMTKPRKGQGGTTEYHLSKSPIPLELLQVQEATEGFALGVRTMSSTINSTVSSQQQPLSPRQPMSPGNNSAVPILLSHLGRRGGDYLLSADSSETRIGWKEKIVQAKADLDHTHAEKHVFEIRTLSDTAFAGSNASGALNNGKVTCSIPYEGAHGIRMIAIGTNMGVWTGVEGDTNSMKQVVAISDVQQIAVLQEHSILVVLADRTLYAYALHALVGSNKPCPSQKIAQHISYFHAGVCNNRMLVIAMKKRGMDSHFRAFEPVCGDLRDAANAKYLTTKTGLFSKQPPPWFKLYKEFYIGAESSAVHLLKARIVVVCVRGFEIIDPEHLAMNRNLPDLQHPDFAPLLSQQEEIRPLGMFRCGGSQYLLCYGQFAFRVDSHGILVPDSWMAWEGTPMSVAFSYPYVIGFDSRFIEVRHALTGELIQIMAGEHMRCLQFSTLPAAGGGPAPIIHGCMAHPFKPEYQYVFELVNTVPLV